jgi:hypothetical protein
MALFRNPPEADESWCQSAGLLVRRTTCTSPRNPARGGQALDFLDLAKLGTRLRGLRVAKRSKEKLLISDLETAQVPNFYLRMDTAKNPYSSGHLILTARLRVHSAQNGKLLTFGTVKNGVFRDGKGFKEGKSVIH